MMFFRLVVLIFVHLILMIYGQNLCGYSTNTKQYDGTDQSKILGGKLSKPWDWPFIVEIETSIGGTCTGTIIGEKWILSAAHCSPQSTPVKIKVNGKIYESEKVVIHNYDPRTKENDIMLIKLKKSIPFSRRALPICLFKNVTAAPGNLAAATGYGIIFEGVKNIDSTLKKGFLPEDDMNFNRTTLLHETPLKIQDINHCKTFATNNKICAGGIMHGTTPGDSGGPLLLVRNNRWVQYGITSYGNYESVPNDVKKVSDRGVYIKVSAYCDWIKDKTSGDIKCQ